MTPAVASERSIFSKNHDSISYVKSFPCCGEHVRTYSLVANGTGSTSYVYIFICNAIFARAFAVMNFSS